MVINMIHPVKRKSRSITSVRKTRSSLLLSSEYGLLQIAPKSETIVRIIFTGREAPSPDIGAGIVNDALYTEWEYEETDVAVTLRTKALTVTAAKKTGSIHYCRADGTLILSERSYESHILEEYDSYKTVEDENAETESIVTPDGVKQRIKTASKVLDKKLYRTRLNLNWQEDEALFGLGQSPEGTLNLRGTTQYLHQANMKIAVPFLLSTKGYGILLATGSPAVFQDTDYGSYLQTEADTQMDFYFIAGDGYADIIKGYRFLTGKAVMLPKWAFGYIQSQERYETADELITTVNEYRKRKVGLDCIVLDWLSWEDGQWGQKSLDPKRFPDSTAMMDEIHAENAHLMISIWPTMHQSCRNNAEFKENGLLLPFSDIYNAFDEEGRKLYWKQANEDLFSHGIDAWWCDSSEPFTPEWSKTEKPEPSALYQEYIREAGNFVPLELSNTYGLFHSQCIYEGQRGVTDSKRVANLTRSGWTGQQKYGTILWSGDIAANWETLRSQITAGLHFCACGLPYWTMDIGAFFIKRGNPWFRNGDYEEGSKDLGYRELYVRWFQFGAFLPIFRAHGTDTRREVWAYGEPGEPFYDALCAAISLRYQLMPYIYSLAGAVWHNDGTMIRFLTFDFPEDAETAKIGDQYMFGPALMVCPVTKPMLYDVGSKPIEGAMQTRSVYLPKGTRWYDFWTNEVYEGGIWIEAAANIERIPLFVREGSILPMTETMNYTDEKPDAPITLRVYPGRDGEFLLYDDSSDGYAYEKGEYRLIRLLWDDAAGKLSREMVHGHPDIHKPEPCFIEEIIRR